MKVKTSTHVQVKISDKDKLIEIRKRTGYASIEVVINKLIAKYGDKLS